MNEALFTTDGRTDLEKQIDIRQYVSGVRDEANRNENLTYRLSDLINYYPQDLEAEGGAGESCLSGREPAGWQNG